MWHDIRGSSVRCQGKPRRLPTTEHLEKATRLSFWDRLFSGEGFMPRRYCGTWDGGLIGLHVVSDAVIWLSYLWIPLVMLWTWRSQKRRLALPRAVLLLLALYVIFITTCGWTHFFDALMFWDPVYRINGVIRAVTAAASFATAVSVVRLLPLAVTAPVTILTQRAELHQRFAWLRDILDSVTDGRLHLCETRGELPGTLSSQPTADVTVRQGTDLATVRTAVRDAADAAGFDSVRLGELLTAVHEAAMNGLQHAGGATVRVFRSGDRVQTWVQDAGGGIPLDRLPISTLKQGYSTAGTAGQGWFLLLTLADSAHLYTGNDGTTVIIDMDRTSPEAIPVAAAVGGNVPFARAA
jgi:anti-sigma regulatory factor (Ser/Thr protein kinase)